MYLRAFIYNQVTVAASVTFGGSGGIGQCLFHAGVFDLAWPTESYPLTAAASVRDCAINRSHLLKRTHCGITRPQPAVVIDFSH